MIDRTLWVSMYVCTQCNVVDRLSAISIWCVVFMMTVIESAALSSLLSAEPELQVTVNTLLEQF